MKDITNRTSNFWGNLKYPWLLIHKFLKIKFIQKLFLYHKHSLKYQNLNFLNKIKKQHTWPLNLSFIIIILLSCFIIAAYSYFFEQEKQINQQLKNQAELVNSRINTQFRGYYDALKLLANHIAMDKNYLDSERILQIIRLSFITDDHIKSLPVTYYSLNESAQGYNAYGDIDPPIINNQVIRSFKEKLNDFSIEDTFEQQAQEALILYYSVFVLEDNSTHMKNSKKLAGYLQLPVELSHMLQSIYDLVSGDDLIKITHKNKSLYFKKHNGKFINFSLLNKEPSHDNHFENHVFSSHIQYLTQDYQISVGKDVSPIKEAFLKVIALRFGIIIILGSIMLIAYNIFERKRAIISYNERFSKILAKMQNHIQDLNQELSTTKNELQVSKQQNNNYLNSIKEIISLEQKINEATNINLHKIKDCNYLLLKHFSQEKKLDPEKIEALFSEINQLSEDLYHNIASREEKITEVDLAEVIDNILTIFFPIITRRSVKVTNNLSNISKVKNKNKEQNLILKTNETVLKQVLLSLLARVLFFITKDSEIIISAKMMNSANSIIIEITDNGLSLNEALFQDIIYKRANDLTPGIVRAIFTLQTIEILAKELLKSDLLIESHLQGNKISLSLPLEQNSQNNVIQLAKLAWGRA